ncbi:MAG: hypothetical protein ACREJC_05935, partial [Tepidisphaeraceae bacterium]
APAVDRHYVMRPHLPGNIAIHYRPATDNEVRAESFGLLNAARINAEQDWRTQRGTFDDQAAFGPKRDFECVCGKYFGRDSAGIICDQCGVKVTTSDVRRTRCGHINLPMPILHPLGGEPAHLNTVPVLPVAFIEAPGGADMLRAYDKVLLGADARELSDAFGMLLDVLAPLLIAAHNWNLSERLLIAHGMALKETAA